MSDYYTLRVLTPAGLAVEAKVTTVTLVSARGEMGILNDHVQYTGLLGTGILSYVGAEDNKTHRLVVSGGFCRFGTEGLTLLADRVDMPDEIDKATYAKNRVDLQKILDTGNPMEQTWTDARVGLDRIEAIDRLQ